jgi:mono/diheme cytochrome c family protein
MTEAMPVRATRILKWSLVVVLSPVIAGLLLFRYKVASGVTAVARGERVAAKMGCFGCHGPGGSGGVANPGSDEKFVPPWNAAADAELIKAPGELDEWVLDGKPKRMREAKEAAGDSPLLDMKAYRGTISTRELRDLRAYLRAVMSLDMPPEQDKTARDGYLMAQKSGCFGCHGPGGRGLTGNPRSLAGYIPAWEGPVFDDLVKNDGELDDWIRNGSTPRMKNNRFANYFLTRQVVEMPPYDAALSDDEVKSVTAYIKWLRVQPAEKN